MYAFVVGYVMMSITPVPIFHFKITNFQCVVILAGLACGFICGIIAVMIAKGP